MSPEWRNLRHATQATRKTDRFIFSTTVVTVSVDDFRQRLLVFVGVQPDRNSWSGLVTTHKVGKGILCEQATQPQKSRAIECIMMNSVGNEYDSSDVVVRFFL